MHQQGYIGRKMRLPKLKEKPAIVITTFGSSSQGKVAIEHFKQKLNQSFSEYELYWAYTSEIIRKKEQLPSLQETLAQIESAGYRKAIVQPLHIFPGTEYQQLLETCNYFPGLRTIVGETLCHRWDFIKEVLEVVSSDFLIGEDCLNLLALHGTPLAADPVNATYLGIERLVAGLYSNVLAASIEGVPDHEAVINQINRNNQDRMIKKTRIIPMMFLAGIHVEDDLMGADDSWRTMLENMGIAVDCPTIEYNNTTYYKGLAFREKCIDFFTDRLTRALTILTYY